MIVVFGATGRTGSVVAAHLQKHGSHAVRLITRDAQRASRHRGAEVVVANLSRESEVGPALEGAQAVYALLPDDFSAEQFHRDRRAMVDVLARCIQRARVPRVVLLSSSTAALGEDGSNGMGADLAYFERALVGTVGDVTVLRACYFQDNMAEAIVIAQSQGIYPCLFASADAAVPMIATADVGAIAAHALLETPRERHQIIDLVGPAYSPREVAAALGRALGRGIALVHVPRSHQEQLFRPAMSEEAARAMVSTLACLGSNGVPLLGAGLKGGNTRLEQTLRTLLEGSTTPLAEVRP